MFIGHIGTDSDWFAYQTLRYSAEQKMVEINNQRKAFLDMLAWSEGTDNGRQKTRKIMVMTSL